jgi:hypothetical protein
MPFPKTLDELRKAGYHYEGDGMCKRCGAAIEWWKTPKKKKMMPCDFGTATPHWATCPSPEDFRK